MRRQIHRLTVLFRRLRALLLKPSVGCLFIFLLSCKKDKEEKLVLTVNAFGDWTMQEGDIAESEAFICKQEGNEEQQEPDEIVVTVTQTIQGDRDIACEVVENMPEYWLSCTAAYKQGHEDWQSVFKIQCKGPGGQSESKKVTISVTDVNQSPQLAAIFAPDDLENVSDTDPLNEEGLDEDVNQSVDVGKKMQVVDIHDGGDDADADGDELKYRCRIFGGIYHQTGSECNQEMTPNIKSARGEISWKPLAIHAEKAATEYIIEVTAVDDQEPSLDSFYRFTVTVLPIPDPAMVSFSGNEEAGDGFIGLNELGSSHELLTLVATNHIEEEVRFSPLLFDEDGSSECHQEISYSETTLPLISQVPEKDGGYFVCAYLVNEGEKEVFVKSQVIQRDTIPPNPPTFSELASYTNQPVFNYQWVPAETTYQHFVKACESNDCQGECQPSHTGKDTADISGMVDGKSYYLCLQAIDPASNLSEWVISPTQIIVDLSPPESPKVDNPKAQTSGQSISITWKSGTDIHFKNDVIQACTDQACSLGCVGTSEDSSGSAEISGLVVGNDYHICVQSFDKSGNSSSMIASSQKIAVFHTGDWDDRFSGDGIVTANHSNHPGSAHGYDVVVDSDHFSYIVGDVAGTSDKDAAIWKYRGDGILDDSFGHQGVLILSDLTGAGSGHDTFYAIALDEHQRLVVTGESNGYMVLLRLRKDGVLDEGFASQGVFVSSLSGSSGKSLAVTDNQIVVTGYGLGVGKDLAVWKFSNDGQLDISFDSDGMVLLNGTAGGNGDDQGNAILVTKEGNIVIAGSSFNGTNLDLIVWQFSGNGDLNRGSFSSPNGYFQHDRAAGGFGDDEGFGLVSDSEGNLMISGRSQGLDNRDAVIWRLTPSGVLDTSFQTRGFIIQDSGEPSGDDSANDLTLDMSGRMIVIGESTGSHGKNMVLWRFQKDGSLDTTFLSSGVLINDPLGPDQGDDRGAAIYLHEESLIRVVGDAFDENTGFQHLSIWSIIN